MNPLRTDGAWRFLFEELDIRGVIVHLGSAWRDMHARRNYPDPLRDLLGELAAVTTVIGSSLKSENRMSFQLQGHGPVSMLVVDCHPIENGPVRLRGMARERDEGDEDDTSASKSPLIAVSPALTFGMSLSQMLGDGQLVLTLNQTESQSYQSVVPLDGETLAEVFEHYLEQSEQQPARLWLHADGEHACALFLQRLPGADERDSDGWNRVTSLAATVKPEELSLPADQLIGRLFTEEVVRLFDPRPVSWHCPRDEQKVKDMLLALGREEVEDMLEDATHIEVEDEICGHRYRFGPELVDELFPPQGRTLH
jgi:molecular chaperone Hsp33